MFDPPDISAHLLRDEGEVIVDVVDKHWVAYLRAVIAGFVAFLLLVISLFADVKVAWVLLLAAFALACYGAVKALAARRDRFVITNMRVFRVHGVLSSNLATMPLSRILDISVQKPLIGRMLGFGHFVFESAAQDQGLREIRYVARPYDRDLAIQRVVQRAGLRGPRLG